MRDDRKFAWEELYTETLVEQREILLKALGYARGVVARSLGEDSTHLDFIDAEIAKGEDRWTRAQELMVLIDGAIAKGEEPWSRAQILKASR